MLCLAAPAPGANPSSSSPSGAGVSGDGARALSHSDSEKMAARSAPSNGGAGSSQTSASNKEWSSDGDAKLRNGALSKSGSNTSVSRMSQTQDDENLPHSLQQLYAQYADVMYTNHANLEHTIKVQQKLFEQQLMQRAQHQQQQRSGTLNGQGKPAAASGDAPPPLPARGSLGQPHHSPHPLPAAELAEYEIGELGSDSRASGDLSPCRSPSYHHYEQIAERPTPPATTPGSPVSATAPSPVATAAAAATPGTSSSCNASGVQMEWVVKRRADGSRYVTRRPVRNKLLKERAKKILEERCGMTTDDDAVSELKVGRYWNKEERKRHLEKARDQRRRKEMVIRQKMETVKEQDELARKEPNIMELSHRKMMRHKGKKVLDDFTTVQEMMAHGNREAQGKTYNPLLSVTTV